MIFLNPKSNFNNFLSYLLDKKSTPYKSTQWHNGYVDMFE